ncbi:MAG: 2-phospho-L-lactate transferase [Anaerolineae bacterium]|nr:2-phospho-L-lactate transferase [Anaerolineae bacterium]
MNVVVLVGGVGGAKLAYGLAQVLPPEKLTVIVNTGDDFWRYGLRICPDLDTIMYTLSGLVDPVNGWGIAGDTLNALQQLRAYGEDDWFRLGDRDLATHILRTRLLHAGVPFTEVTERLTKSLGISQRILPMTDAPVATMIETMEYGEIEFQEYFVRHRWQPTVKALRLEGIDKAVLTPAVDQALKVADAILIGPSNPWLSIEPILAVSGMRDAIMKRDVPRVAVSPIVGGQAIKGPAAKMMAELGYPVSAASVAAYYGDMLNGFVYDQMDAGLLVPQPHVLNCETVMNTTNDKVLLARTVLDWIKGWS